MGVDEADDFFVLELVEPEFLLLLLEDEFLALEFVLEVLALALERPDLLVAFALDVCPLVLELLHLLLELRYYLFVDFLAVGLLLLEFVLDLLHLLLLYDVGLVQLADLLLFFVYGLHLLLRLLGQLLQLLLHPADLVGSLTVFVVLQCLLLRLPDFLQRLFLLLESLELSLEVLQFVLLLYYFIDVVFAIEIPPEFGDFCLVLLDAYFLLFEFLLELHHAFVLLTLPRRLLLLLPLPFLLYYFVHLGGQLLQLPLQLYVLLDQLSLPGLNTNYALFSAMSERFDKNITHSNRDG